MNRAQFSFVVLFASCAFIALNVINFIQLHERKSELSSDDVHVSSNEVTILNDKLWKSGVNTGENWKVDESVPVGELNPAISVFQSGSRSGSGNSSSNPTARPVEDNGEYYGNVLQRSGVNTGEVNSQWNRRFSNAGTLEPSYSVGPAPNREKESFSGMVDDVLSGKENSGNTVKKAVKNFDRALTQFLRVEVPTSSISRPARTANLRQQRRQGTIAAPVSNEASPNVVIDASRSRSNLLTPCRTQADAHSFFAAHLSPYIAAQHGNPSTDRSDDPPSQLLAFSTPSHPKPAEREIDPSVEQAGHELFAQIKQADLPTRPPATPARLTPQPPPPPASLVLPPLAAGRIVRGGPTSRKPIAGSDSQLSALRPPAVAQPASVSAAGSLASSILIGGRPAAHVAGSREGCRTNGPRCHGIP